jgi:hypothetical protein
MGRKPGFKHSEETLRKMSKPRYEGFRQKMCKPKPEGFGQKMSLIRMGIVFSEETRQKMSLSRRGKSHTAEGCQNISLAKKGKSLGSHTEECKKKISLALKKKYFNPLLEIFPEDKDFYLTDEWIKIRQYVLERDNFTCQDCGRQDCKLNAHHEIPRKISHDDSYENLKTLCCSCHWKADQKYYRNLAFGDSGA